ncbi:hypothetical protein Leryth_022392 [Lithospermum erythrorhizon]|nr:hypothetical protein Leryth_022392 [Lithospermum erythrorhizon]
MPHTIEKSRSNRSTKIIKVLRNTFTSKSLSKREENIAGWNSNSFLLRYKCIDRSSRRKSRMEKFCVIYGNPLISKSTETSYL